jgi:hypothetical protein
MVGGDCVSTAPITYFHSSESFLLTKQKVNHIGHHRYYSPALSEGYG